MHLLQILAYVITLAEFGASSFFTLTGSQAHLRRLQEVHFPLGVARILAMIEVIAVVGLVAGIWIPPLRVAGGLTLALCFLPFLLRSAQVNRPITDSLALALFMLCSITAATV